MVRHSIYTIIICSLLASCAGKGQDDSEVAVRASFDSAMKSLSERNYDDYLKGVDFGTDMDSVQRQFMLDVLKQHLERQEEEKGKLVNVHVSSVSFKSDTVCTVYYELTFEDSTKDLSSQKMIKTGDEWKIRLRN